jgi:hypothetical protein
MGLTTRFFSPSPKLTSYTNKYGYGYRFRYNDEGMKDSSMGVLILMNDFLDD